MEYPNKEYLREYYLKNREEIRRKQNEYFKKRYAYKTPEQKKVTVEKNRIWAKENHDRLRPSRKRYWSNRRKTDVSYQIKIRMYGLVGKALNGKVKTDRTHILLGWKKEDFLKLELFKEKRAQTPDTLRLRTPPGIPREAVC